MVARFVQGSITEALDRQKRKANKNERRDVLLFNEGDSILLYTVNLLRHIATNVGSYKLIPMFIVPLCYAA